MDRHLLPTLLLVVILIASTVYGKENTDDLSCPEHQLNFEGSCYEFVTQQHSFLSAQKWCEQGGGHLAFIKDDITQRFLQAHLLPEENWWFGLAYTSFNQDSSEGPVSWLDGSHVSFSNWHNEPILDKGCGYMMKDSGFQWVTTSNCSQQFFFICEFELGHALACKDHNAMLMCGSGQVIRIDDSFYGRKTEHYCRANHSLEPASAQQVCSWLDVLDSVSESCDGLQMCEVSANVTSYGEPCPRLTSYLSVKYHCEEVFHSSAKDGLKTSSQFKRSIKAQQRDGRNYFGCKQLADDCEKVSIKCSPRCDPADPSKTLTLEIDSKDWVAQNWYFQEYYSNNGVLKSCKSDKKLYGKEQNGQRGLQQFTISTNTLQQYFNNRRSIYVVFKGLKTKHSKVGYGCQEILWSFQTTPSPSTTRQINTTTAPSSCVSQLSPSTCSVSLSTVPAITPFSINCTVPDGFCCYGPCTYCVKTSNGNFVYCGDEDGMRSLYLPKGFYELNITAKNKAKQTIINTVSIDVTDIVVTSILSLQPIVQANVSATVLAQLFQGITDYINKQIYVEPAVKAQLVEDMVTNLCTTLTNGSSLSYVDEVELISQSTLSIIIMNNTLTPNALEGTMCILQKVSNSQTSMSPDAQNITQTMLKTAEPIVNSINALLRGYFNTDQQRNVFDSILTVLDNVHSSLLKYKTPGGEPAIINTPLINVYANRLLPAHFKDTYEVKIDNESAGFVLPTVFSKLLPAQVDVRMLSLKVNPYEWSEGEEISSVVGGLSLTNLNGSVIPVKNLNEEIEILLPRLNGENISSTFLDLRNYSTMAINVSNPGTSLVLKLEPLYKTDLVLLLGFEYHPNDTKYLVKTKMPQSGSTEEERYTWVVGSNYISKEGVYYLLVRPVVPPGINSTNASVSVTSVAVNCKFWRDKKANWSNSGCRVGPRSTPQVTQCLCTHLTFFGSSFFVMPNTVDVSRTAELFSTFSNNPVVVCFVGAIILVYILAVIWARRKDLQDKIKVKVTVLEDNDPLAEYRYLVAVATGYRRGAATTSNVTLMLKGTVWESKPHHLTDPEKKVFTRGGVDLFLLTTPFSVGEVEGVRLWHDNSGEYPDWYVNKVVVYDLETGEKWQFLCNSWLSVDMGECTLDKTFYIATEADLKGFHNLFFTKTAKDLCDGHIWYSVLNRPAHSSFTRVQRLSCCFSLLLCTMLTSLMFWGIPASPAEQDTELGSIKFNWQQIMVGIQSSIIMFPVNLLIVTIFRFTRPRQKSEPKKQTKSDSIKKKKKCTDNFLDLCIKKEVTMELIIKDLKRILRYLAKIVHCPTPNAALDSEPTDIITLVFLLEDFIRQQNFGVGRFYIDDIQMDRFSMYRKFLYKQVLNLEKQLKLLGPSSFPKPEGYITTLMQVQGMKHVLEPYLSVPDPVVTDGVDDDNKGKKKCCANGLPWWFVFVGWILVLASSGVSAYFTMMYGLTYGKERSINWLISISVSFFESLFVTQPLKVLGFAVFFALVVKSINEEEINYFQLLKDMKLTYTDDPDDVRISRRDSTCIYYQPPPLSEIEKMKINRIKNQKAFALIWEIIIYLAFLCVLLVATYGQRDPNAYFLTQHIEQSFSSGIADSMGPKDVFNWINSSVLSNIFGVNPGFITDGNSKLVGSARIRQVRVRKDSCKIPNHMRPSIPDCHAPYSRDVEDRGSYSTGWNQSISVNISQPFLMPWVYQTQSTLRGHPIWGNVGFYRGGGYVLDLGLDEDNARSMLLDLFENTWLDTYTRAFFVEFTVYNANVNLFCIVTLMLETTAVGAFQYRSELHNLRLYQATEGVNVVASEVIYFLFILYYMFVQAKRIKQQKCSYFKSKLNLLEMAIIFLSWSAAGAIINRTVQGDQDLKYFQEHKDHFPSFYDTATADDVLGYILAFLILLATVKMWHLMRLNSKLNLITCTLQRAWNDISSFIVVITIMFLAYSVVSNLLFGWKLYTYKTLQDAALAVVGLQLGTFNYDEVLDLNPVLGAFIVGSCIIFMTFVVLNLFISVILEAFSEEQKQHQPSEEEEIVDLMIVKICKMFGIKIKKKQ